MAPPTLTAAAPPAAVTAGPTPAAAPADGPVTLAWWTPEFFSPSAPHPAGPAVAEEIAEFEAAQEGQVRIEPVLKARYGKGGLLDFLRTAQPVAPGVMPDIVTLDVTELEHAVRAGLIQPLGELLGEGFTDGLYPFARAAGVFDNQPYAVQYLADLEHAAYLSSQVQEPPDTWNELLAAQVPYLFPLAEPQPNSSTTPAESLQHSVLSQYASAGGKLDPVTRQPVLEIDPLIRLLEFYEAGSESGVLPPEALELATSDAAWGVYVQGRAPMAYVGARRYLAEREALKGSGFAAAPGWQQPAVPIAGGWALAIVTRDPERQRLAAEFITSMLESERAGNLARATGWLPPSPAALETWGNVPYYSFLDDQLRAAISPPFGPGYPEVADRIQKAITSVLVDGISPAEAAQNAVNQR